MSANERAVPMSHAADDASELVVSDLGALKALANPLRVRMLEALGSEPQTVKQLAARLAEPQTKLYRHMRILEKSGLVKVAGSRLVSGILERQYRSAAPAMRLDRTLLAPVAEAAGGELAGLDFLLKALFEQTRTEIRDGVKGGVIDPALAPRAPRSLLATRGRLQLTAQQAADLRYRLIELTQHFTRQGGTSETPSPPGAAGQPQPQPTLHAISLVFYPLETPAGESDPGGGSGPDGADRGASS